LKSKTRKENNEGKVYMEFLATTTMTTMRVKCPKCGYEWDYKGRLIVATCPSCKSSVKVKEWKPTT
jgi:predicted Zn-ribbon and HTH transcriptional regulator